MQYLLKRFQTYTLWQQLLLIITFIFPFIFAITKVLSGELSFWYDNARDLLSAWNNLSDPTLIGPTSGIPGIFYGPYWIWLLSIPLLFSKDPRFVAFVVGVIPYFIIFPILLYQFRKIISLPTLCIMWILFSTSFGLTYAHNLWNPRIAPVLTLLLIILLSKATNQLVNSPKRFFFLATSGFVSGVIINVHISFGIGVFLGSLLYLLLDIIIFQRKRKEKIIFESLKLVSFFAGVGIAFLPFFLFELRHNFSQVTTAAHALSKFGDVVILRGLSKLEILSEILKSIKVLFHLPLSTTFTLPIFGVTATVILYFGYRHITKKQLFSLEKKKLLLLIFSLFITIFTLYITARNPIWDYHFIGVEIIFLLLFALFVDQFSILKKFLVVVCIIIFCQTSVTFLREAQQPPFTVSNLRTKVHITDIIANDAGSTDYTVFSYQPSIYQYEYTYLFRWRYQKDVQYDPGQISKNHSVVYLILNSSTETSLITNFINYNTPEKTYTTERLWQIADGSRVLKRRLLNNY